MGKYYMIAIIMFTVIVLVDVATPFGGSLHFYREWVRCGNRPYYADGLLGGHISYYRKASAVGFLRGNDTKYYCTPIEAEKAGISANPHSYDYPELDKLKKN